MKSSLVQVASVQENGLSFQVKGKAFQEGYLFLSPEMAFLFPYKDDLSSITFLDEDNVNHSAIFHRSRGYMVCLTFGEWWERRKIKEGDLIGIDLISLPSRQYRLRQLNAKTQGDSEDPELEIKLVFRPMGGLPIVYNDGNLDVLKKLITGEFSPFKETALILGG